MSIEKLTLEYLVPYLPYGLKGIFTDLPGGRPFEVIGLTIDNEEDELVMVHGCPGRWGGQVSEISNFKPLMIPLTESNLKSRMSNGLIPLHELLISSCFDLSKMDEDEIEGYCGQFTMYELLCIKDFKLLCKWHFDVFGLIEKGLAFDIKTLEKTNPAI